MYHVAQGKSHYQIRNDYTMNIINCLEMVWTLISTVGAIFFFWRDMLISFTRI